MKNIFLLILCLTVSGCIYSQHTSERSQGTRISPQQLAAIELGKTNRQWILTNLGIPERTHSEEGLEVFEYVSDQRHTSEKYFIFLFKINSEKDISQKLTRVVMRNGIVEAVTLNPSEMYENKQ